MILRKRSLCPVESVPGEAAEASPREPRRRRFLPKFTVRQWVFVAIVTGLVYLRYNPEALSAPTTEEDDGGWLWDILTSAVYWLFEFFMSLLDAAVMGVWNLLVMCAQATFGWVGHPAVPAIKDAMEITGHYIPWQYGLTLFQCYATFLVMFITIKIIRSLIPLPLS